MGGNGVLVVYDGTADVLAVGLDIVCVPVVLVLVLLLLQAVNGSLDLCAVFHTERLPASFLHGTQLLYEVSQYLTVVVQWRRGQRPVGTADQTHGLWVLEQWAVVQ